MKQVAIVAAFVALLASALAGLSAPALAEDRMEEATVVGKDRSSQAGQVPTDTRPAAVESKMKKEQAPVGLKSDAPGVRTQEKMEKPKMAEPERKKPEQKKGLAENMWLWILLIGGIAAAAG